MGLSPNDVPFGRPKRDTLNTPPGNRAESWTVAGNLKEPAHVVVDSYPVAPLFASSLVSFKQGQQDMAVHFLGGIARIQSCWKRLKGCTQNLPSNGLGPTAEWTSAVATENRF